MSKSKRRNAKAWRREQRRLRAAAAPNSGPLTIACSAQIDLAAEADGKVAKAPTFSIDAYNGGAMRPSGYYRDVVVDLAGLRSRGAIPILLDHDRSKIVGQATEVMINRNSVKLNGAVTGDWNDKSEPAGRVVMHARGGFKWQASVGVSVSKFESVGENAVVNVNGREFRGPVLIARSGRLDEVSFVAVGADETTSTAIAAGGKHMAFDEWLKSKGWDDPASLSASQKASLQAIYEAEVAAAADDTSDDDSDEDASPKKKAKTKVAAAADDLDDDASDDSLINFRAAQAAESKRIAGIRQICAAGGSAGGNPHDLDAAALADIEAKAIAGGWSKDKTELAVLRAAREKAAPQVRGASSRQISAAAVEAALCMSACGMSEDQVGEWYSEDAMNAALGRDLRRMTLQGLMHMVCAAAGRPLRAGPMDDETVREALQVSRNIEASGHGLTTLSLPGILSNVANKALLAAYEAVEPVAQRVCRIRQANDFKTMTSYRLTVGGAFAKIGPSGELKQGSLSEASFTNRVDTYGQELILTRQMIINDDLNAFMEIPSGLGRLSGLAVEEAWATLLLSNPSSFFHAANNGNYATGAGTALSIAALTQAETLLNKQKDANGKPIKLRAKYLLVPPDLLVTAQNLMKETRVNEAATAGSPQPAANPHAGKWEPLMSQYLSNSSFTGYSALAWYLWGDPALVPAMTLAFLRGQQTPTLQQGETDFNILGVRWRCYFDFGVAMEDPKGAVKMKGEA